MEHYATIRREEIIQFVVIQMELERIMLSEVILRAKDKYKIILLICIIGRRKNKGIV